MCIQHVSLIQFIHQNAHESDKLLLNKTLGCCPLQSCNTDADPDLWPFCGGGENKTVFVSL